MLLFTLVQMIDYLISVISTVVLVQIVLGLLIAFQVVNTRNNLVMAVWQALNAILDPVLTPIRRLLPPSGGIDFSPMVLIVGLNLVSILLGGLARSAGGY